MVLFHLTTLYPKEPTLEMKVSYLKLREHVNVHRNWLKCGTFPKGDSRKHIHFRNKALKKVPNNQWMLILDSDELLFGDFRILKEILVSLQERNEIVANILEIRSSLDMLLRPRLIYKQEGMRYVDRHDAIYLKGRNILASEHIRSRLECLGFLHYRFADHLTVKRISSAEVTY